MKRGLRRPTARRHHYAATCEDLEDIYAQSVLEVLLRVRRDPTVTAPATSPSTVPAIHEPPGRSLPRIGRDAAPAAAMLAGAVRLGHRTSGASRAARTSSAKCRPRADA